MGRSEEEMDAWGISRVSPGGTSGGGAVAVKRVSLYVPADSESPYLSPPVPFSMGVLSDTVHVGASTVEFLYRSRSGSWTQCGVAKEAARTDRMCMCAFLIATKVNGDVRLSVPQTK